MAETAWFGVEKTLPYAASGGSSKGATLKALFAPPVAEIAWFGVEKTLPYAAGGETTAPAQRDRRVVSCKHPSIYLFFAIREGLSPSFFRAVFHPLELAFFVF